MDMTAEQYPALKSELTLNPKAMPYAGKTDQQIADLLNLVGGSNEKKTGSGVVPSYAIVGCIVASEWSALLPTAREKLSFWLASGHVDTSDPDVRTALGSIFGAQSTTQANLVMAFDTPVARAEVLFGAGFEVKPWDVARARDLP